MSQLAVPVGVVSIVLMMVVPLPTFLLDLLIAANITAALLIVLVSMFVRRPLDFAVFPSLLLVATLFRLALNVSATRLVLTDGFAGKVIDAFGHFVIGGSLVVGLVVFLILIIIQFIVITNGAGRVAEVGARFTLDAMPGKQMAIDADLNAGLIDDVEARRRRAEVAAEADFYGAMDGGSKFVKGDAIAAIVITMVNLVGGFVVGVLQKHMPVSDAVKTYSLLSVGDGLVSQIPALLLSVATGLIVTRSTTHGDMGSDVLDQFGRHRRALQIAGATALFMVVIPGIPKVPFLVVGSGVLFLASRAKAVDSEEETRTDPKEPSTVPSPDSPQALSEAMRVDPLSLELAADVVDLVDNALGGDLLDRVRALRRKIALDIGIVMPLLRTRDNLQLPPGHYAIRIGGVEVARGEAPAGTVLAIGENLDGLPGRATREPVFGLAARWVPAELKYQAEVSGATVVDRSSVVTTHLADVVQHHASRLLSREDVRALLDTVKRNNPTVIEELIPVPLSLGEVQRVLQALLEEQVPIRDLVRICEALSLRARTATDPESLVEAARSALGPVLASSYAMEGTVSVLTLDPRLEQTLAESARPGEGGLVLLLEADTAERVLRQLRVAVEDAEERGVTPVLTCAPQLRTALRRLLKGSLPRLPVLAYNELEGVQRIETIGVVTVAHAPAA
jgi:flagellar biosynthesis protein FlhA